MWLFFTVHLNGYVVLVVLVIMFRPLPLSHVMVISVGRIAYDGSVLFVRPHVLPVSANLTVRVRRYKKCIDGSGVWEGSDSMGVLEKPLQE